MPSRGPEQDARGGSPSLDPPAAYSVERQKRLVLQGLRRRRRVRRIKSLKKVNCPYCLTEFGRGDRVVLCPICRLVHHVECWMENEGCTSYGCAAAPLRTLAPSPVADEPPAAAEEPAAAGVGSGPTVCTCGSPIAADAGYCLVCGRSRGEMRPPRRRPASPPRVPHALLPSTRNAVWICLALAVATGALGAVFLPWMDDVEGVSLVVVLFIVYCGFLVRTIHHGLLMLRELRVRPFEYGRGAAAAAIGFALLSPGLIAGVGWFVHANLGR